MSVLALKSRLWNSRFCAQVDTIGQSMQIELRNIVEESG